MAQRFQRRLTVAGGAATDDLQDVRLVLDDYLMPAAACLKQSAEEGDVDAVRAYAYELLTLTGSVIAACPLPRRGSHFG